MDVFTFGGQDIHFLNNFRSETECILLVGGETFPFSIEQIAFLSPSIFSHFMNSREPFVIDIIGNDTGNFVECFKEINSLFFETSTLSISPQKSSFYSTIAELLENSSLFEVCDSFSANESIFSFDSTHLKSLSFEGRKLLKNFTFRVNSTKIQVNYNLFCCLSNQFSTINKSEQKMKFSVSDDVLKCFCSFIKVLDGVPFRWKNFQFSTINSMIETFHLESLQIFINQFLCPPKNVEDAIQLLSGSTISLSEDIYQKSLSILFDNFSSLNADQLNSLSVQTLQLLFSSDKLKILDEKFRLDLINNLIKKNPERRILLKNVKFHSLSSKPLKEFLNSIDVEDLDFDLFDQIKNEFQNLKENYEKLSQENANLEKENQTLKEKLQIDSLKLSDFSKILENAKQILEEVQSNNKKITEERNQISREISGAKTEILKEVQNSNKKITEERNQTSSEISGAKTEILKEVQNSNKKITEERNQISSEISGAKTEILKEVQNSNKKITEERNQTSRVISGAKTEILKEVQNSNKKIVEEKNQILNKQIIPRKADIPVHRLYNPKSGLHFYTEDGNEKEHLVKLGWSYEGNPFNGSHQGMPVFRLYHHPSGNHLFTLNSNEKNHLVSNGWNDEGIRWKAFQDGKSPIFRLYNPGNGDHLLTTDRGEKEKVIGWGWKDEGVAWYSV